MAEYLLITSKKTGVVYQIHHLKQYRVEQSLEVPADGFDFIVGNMNGEVSDLISAGDKLQFFIGSDLVLDGYIDDAQIEYALGSNDFRINGRDKMSLLIDNDANPKTYNNLGMADYCKKVLPQYGITSFNSPNNKFSKIVISPGETEYSIIERLAQEKGWTVFCDSSGKLNIGNLRADSNVDYYFSNDVNYGIRIKDALISVSADIRNEVIVYGETSGSSQIKGSYKDGSMVIKKRKVLNEADIENKTDADKKAKQEFYNTNKNAFSVKITTKTNNRISINKIAQVIIKKYALDVKLLIESVEYTKDKSSGSITNITMKLIPGVRTTWKNNVFPLLPKI